jgi:DNA-binding MarR family transcriptional regulator
MSKKLQLTDLVWCNGLSVRKLSRKVTQLYDSALAPSGLRSTQVHILGELYQRQKSPPTLSELAEAMVLDRSGLGHNLRPLERDGFVEMQENENDRRERHLVLTEAGIDKLKEAFPLWAKAQEMFNTLYGAEKMEELRQSFKTIAYDERLV